MSRIFKTKNITSTPTSRTEDSRYVPKVEKRDTFVSKPVEQTPAAAPAPARSKPVVDDDDLEIPAFLRRKMK